MNVLGVHGFDDDAGAALVCDGEMFFIPQERLTRKKHDGGFPEESIFYVMDLAGLKKPGEIDMVVFDSMGKQTGKMRRRLKKMGCEGKTISVSHHDALAAAAYFTGPFEEAAALVIDSRGSLADEMPDAPPFYASHPFSRELHSMYVGKAGRLNVLNRTFSSSGWGVGPGAMRVLGAMTAGFSKHDGEKLIALAALGERDDVFPECAFTDFEGSCLAEGEPEIDPRAEENVQYYSKLFFRNLPRRKQEWPIRRVHCELARAVHNQSSNAAVSMARFLYEATGFENLCVGGEFGLSCDFNSAPAKKTPFKDIFINPVAAGAGAALGAALHGYHVTAGLPFVPKMFSPCLGKKYSEHEILSALSEFPRVKYCRPRRLEEKAVELLSLGKICGWFKGRSEVCSQSFGSRGILADPRDLDIRRRLNTEIKCGESFLTHAIAIMADDAAEYFHICGESPNMHGILRARNGVKRKLPAVVLKNGTAMVRTVNRGEPLFELLDAFGRRTDVPALLNASFNREGEPIVETPVDALRFFMSSKIDFLILEDWLVTKKGSAHDSF
ncbi:MAG TPA: carbamoyltransferase C-terminal domain-containing protein [bacterium]|nr:carbamoyltransferase C-terminal domain-containing protein [bacterium]